MSQPTPSRRRRRRARAAQWTGPKRPYDLAKEFVVALVVVGLHGGDRRAGAVVP